jgi:GntR family transcriptional regulator
MHPYEQVSEHLRERIRSGELRPGARLPSVRDLASQHAVAPETARRALSWLAESGAVRTTQRGTYVADHPPVGSSPTDRLGLWRRSGSTLPGAEYAQGLQCQWVRPPQHVAEIHDLEPGAAAHRRTYLIREGVALPDGDAGAAVGDPADRVIATVTEWWAPDVVEATPGLDDPRICPGHALTVVQDACERAPTSGRDAARAREAEGMEADRLRVRPGAPVLAVAWQWSDSALMVYGEMTVRSGVDIGYTHG